MRIILENHDTIQAEVHHPKTGAIVAQAGISKTGDRLSVYAFPKVKHEAEKKLEEIISNIKPCIDSLSVLFEHIYKNGYRPEMKKEISYYIGKIKESATL